MRFNVSVIVHFGTENLCIEWPSSTVVVGTFDGVHLGHQYLLNQTVELARNHRQPSAVVTFDRNPLSVIAPEKCPPSIATLEQNVIAIRRTGAAICVILPFTSDFSQLSAQRFYDEILVKALHAKRVVVGHDFGFGKGREGNAEWLRNRIETHVIEPFLVNQSRVSSSQIRQMVSNGEVEAAATILGRNFSIVGAVIEGERLGRTIGYPTINLARSSNCLIPSDGIYAGACQVGKSTYRAAISIGFRPTVGGTHRTIEAYLLDYPGEEIYGLTVEIFFTHRLRGELNFPDLERLKRQIEDDVEKTRALVEL